MYEIVERFLARVWLGNLGLNPTVTGIAEIAKAIGRDDFVPMLAQEATAAGVVRLIAGSWDDGLYRLLVRADSIDLEYRMPASGAPVISFADFLTSSGALLAGAAEHFNRQAFRIAGVQEGILAAMDDERMQLVAHRLLNTAPSLGASLFEWDWRLGSKVTRAFDGVQESGNTIASVKRIAGFINETTPFDRLRLSTDINTEQSNTTPRFTSASVRSYFEHSAQWHQDLYREVGDLMGVPS